MFGEINYLMEQHLFPSLSNARLRRIAPIVPCTERFAREIFAHLEHSTLIQDA